MVVSILGCGWYGTALAKSLVKRGIEVKGSTTTAEKLDVLSRQGIKPYLIRLDGTGQHLTDSDVFTCDQLILANNVKMDDEEAYLVKVEQTLAFIRRHQIKNVIFISSISVYGDHNQFVNEATAPAPSKGSGQCLLQAEALFRDQADFSCTILRFGGLVGPGRDPARFFAGKKGIPNGLSPVNLIHLDDCIGLTEKILSTESAPGLINAVAPHHPEKAAFYQHAAQKSGLVLPEFIAEKKAWKVVDSLSVKPQLDYDFKVKNWFDPEISL